MLFGGCWCGWGRWNRTQAQGKRRAPFNCCSCPMGLVPSRSCLLPGPPRRLLEPMMRNTCFWAALVLRSAAKGRAKKKRKKKRKEGKKRALVFSASTDNSPIDVLWVTAGRQAIAVSESLPPRGALHLFPGPALAGAGMRGGWALQSASDCFPLCWSSGSRGGGARQQDGGPQWKVAEEQVEPACSNWWTLFQC